MYSKKEGLHLKKMFWTAFAEAYPRKWLLYNTKIKDVSFKFYIDNKKAQVLLEIEPKDDDKRTIYYEKVYSLKAILIEDFLEDAIFEQHYYLENGKEVSRIWVEKQVLVVTIKRLGTKHLISSMKKWMPLNASFMNMKRI